MGKVQGQPKEHRVSLNNEIELYEVTGKTGGWVIKKQKAVGTIHAGDDADWDKNTNEEEAHFGRKQVGNHDKSRGVRTAHFISDVDQGGDSHQPVFHQFPVVIKRPNVLSMNEPSLHRLHDVHNKFSARACFADEFVTEHVLSGLFRDAGVDSSPRPPRLGA